MTKSALLTLDESRLRREVLLPMFKAMGFNDVFEYHGGALEQGKDIVMWRAEPSGARVNYAVVVKAKPITGQASGAASAAEVCFQVQQCFGQRYQDPAAPGLQTVHQCYVVSPHELKKEALQSLESVLSSAKLDRSVVYLCGDKLWELIDRHLSERAILERAAAIQKALAQSPNHHGVTLSVTHEQIRLHVSPPPGAGGDDMIRAKLQFPSDADGEAAMRALESFIKTGEPVVIRGEHIVDFQLPDWLGRLGLGHPESFELGAREMPEVALLDVEIASHAGVSRIENLPFSGRVGTEELTLMSDCTEQPWRFGLRFVRPSHAFTFTVRTEYGGLNVKRQLDVANFVGALAAGGVLSVENAQTGQLVAQTAVAPGQVEAPGPHLVRLLEVLLEIQQRTGKLLSLPMGPLDREEVVTAFIVFDALQGKPIKRRVDEMTMNLRPGAAGPLLSDSIADKSQRFSLASAEEVNVFGTVIPLGQVIQVIDGMSLTPESVVALSSAISNHDAEIQVTLKASRSSLNTTAYFPDWLSPDEAKRLRATFGIPETGGK